MYTTAFELIRQFGFPKIAKYAAPVGGVVTARLLESLLSGTSPPAGTTSDQLATGQQAVQRISEAISAAESEVNSYLVKRFHIPLSPRLLLANQFLLRKHTNNLVIYHLALHKPLDSITDRYNRSLDWLKQVINGKTGSLSFGEIADQGVAGSRLTPPLSIRQSRSKLAWQRY